MVYYMGDKSYWEEKFKARNDILMQPEELLLKDKARYNFGKKGLELACGDGRNLLYLAKQGYEMTGIDFSESGLERLEKFALQNNIVIQTMLADLSSMEFLQYIEKYDFIYINHYRLSQPIYPYVAEHLHQGGYLWVNGFSEVPKDNKDITEDDIIIKSDFELLKINELDYMEYEKCSRKYSRALFKKV